MNFLLVVLTFIAEASLGGGILWLGVSALHGIAPDLTFKNCVGIWLVVRGLSVAAKLSSASATDATLVRIQTPRA